MRDKNSTGRVVWINGAFGAGKTTVARLLVDSIPGAVLVDPEEVGSMLRSVLQPVAPVRDFQEWPAWRQLVAATLNAVAGELQEHGPRLLIVPQTITNRLHWSQIRAALDPGVQMTAVALDVEADEHRRRATEDTEEPAALPWRLARFKDFLAADWIREEFTVIESSALAPAEVANAVLTVLPAGMYD